MGKLLIGFNSLHARETKQDDNEQNVLNLPLQSINNDRRRASKKGLTSGPNMFSCVMGEGSQSFLFDHAANKEFRVPWAN